MSTNTPPFARRSDLDALRAVAMLLGIALHSALSFFPAFWVVSDRRQSPGFGVFFSAVHGFRMPLFFVMSGFFSAMLMSRRGRGALVKHRFRRVFLPLLLGLVTIIPLTNWISGVAMSSASRKPAGASSTEGKSDIWAAADAGDLGAIERHLAAGAAVDGRDGERGMTPLLWAALADRAEAAELLIRRGADVNAAASDGGTPLHAAAFLGHEKAVATLIQNGANVNAENKLGATPLDNAVVDEPTTLFFASLLQLKVNEDGLGSRKAAVAAYLRERGATEGMKKAGLADLLMQMPLFSHLWFLWFLWWLVLGMAALSALGARLPSIRLPAWLVLSPARYLWLIPLTMIPQSYMGGGGDSPLFGPDTSTGLLPIPHVLAYYAIFFGFGALYFGYDDRSGRVGERWLLPLSIALLIVFPLELALLGGWAGPAGVALDPPTLRILSIALQAAYPWLMTFGLMGLFRRICAVESPTTRYMSDSAYWLYLAHTPLVIAAQYAVRDWPLPALLKFLIIVAVVTLFLLWTYQTFVRYTWLGRFLNGPRERPTRAGEPAVVA
ncbi:MAG: acyltransferase family protein [Paludisphaera borealis]|uniref:acyltransferase family protein n=1 Tax=Paludisphaera borealis TaxID=1387353 RepID=UPI002842B79B|nr:acyltransferase family protein [Paludisphaera borealis]MDR3623121.1 acyltransferase family protein [Paludisphaera borealis]